MEDFILGLVEFLPTVDFNKVFLVVGLGIFLVWISIAIWVWKDAINRYDSKVPPVIFALVTLVFFVFGYLVYVILRPRETKEEKYWSEREKEFLMHEIGDYDICPKCGYDQIFIEFLKCPSCGHEIRHKCESCSFALTKHWKHCPSCGKENSKYDPKAKQDPNEVLIGELDKREIKLEETKEIKKLNENGNSKDILKEVKGDKPKINFMSPIKFVIDVYISFFSTIGIAVKTFFSGIGKGVGNIKSRVSKGFAGQKKRSQAKAAINSTKGISSPKKSKKRRSARKKKSRARKK